MNDRLKQVNDLRARLASLEHQYESIDADRRRIEAEIAGLEADPEGKDPGVALAARLEITNIPPRVLRFVEQAGIKDKLEEVFGYGTTLADLSICKHTLDTCGCSREFLWSRKAADATEGADVREVPVSTPDVCRHHAHMYADMGKLHATILGENQHRQHVLTEVLKAAPTRVKQKRTMHDGTQQDEFKFHPRLEYDDDRELVLEWPHATDDIALHVIVHDHLAKVFPTRRVKVPRAQRPKVTGG